MKKLLGTLACAFIIQLAFAQKKSLVGVVIDEKNNQPIEGAVVNINNEYVITKDDGSFTFSITKPYSIVIKVTSIGFVNLEQKITESEASKSIILKLKRKELNLQSLEVKATRANSKAPFTKTNLSKEEIAKVNLGQDLPFILNQTPSVVVNSDAGTGIGYTGINIRGTDATRINVTLNGIPYNDAESQGTFFVNLPDFASSANSIQIQRGVGTSTNGTGAFGATINVSTNEFNELPYAELNNTFGSFNTFKHTVKVGTGLIDNHFTVDARLSKITSDGFIDRASSNLQAFYLSGAYINKKSSLRLNIFSGNEKTYQAWNGIEQSVLATNRTFNVSGTEKPGEPYNNETDNYKQTHYQLFFNHQINNHWSFNAATFLTRGIGYYENYRANQRFSNYGLPNVVIGTTTFTRTDLVRQLWLDNYFYGQNYSAEYKKDKNLLTVGIGWSKYDGEHYGRVPWAAMGIVKDHEYYNLDAFKNDANVFAKWQHQLNNQLSFFVDAQFRQVEHRMDGFRNNPTLKVNRSFSFFNPKLGFTYIKNGWQSYISYAQANKEPNRNDFEAGVDVQPNAEKLHDFELGIEKRTNKFHFATTVYYMLYKNQLVLTGKINDVGAYTRSNVDNSYRLGIEVQGAYIFNKWLNAQANFTLSENKIKAYTEYADDYDNGGQITIEHKNTNIALSPSFIASGSINILPLKNIELSFISKYVGKQYLDNAQNEGRILPSFFTQDVRVSYTIKNKGFKEWNIIAQVNNVLDRKYEANGYTFSYVAGGNLTTENYFFPMAGTNFMLGVNIKM
jgi:iron complex outermembrane receptor protein